MNKRTTHLKTSLFLPTQTHICFSLCLCVCVPVWSLFSWAMARHTFWNMLLLLLLRIVCALLFISAQGHTMTTTKTITTDKFWNFEHCLKRAISVKRIKREPSGNACSDLNRGTGGAHGLSHTQLQMQQNETKFNKLFECKNKYALSHSLTQTHTQTERVLTTISHSHLPQLTSAGRTYSLTHKLVHL